MTRKKKLVTNTIVSFVNQVITLICGFILPRMFLVFYGSTVNGLVSSITQFLSVITLCEFGVGSVVQFALYGPLAENDDEGISRIIISAERFFHKLAYILLGYTALLMIVYPYLTIDAFDYLSTFSLIFAISIQSFSQYYFGMTNRILLSADQMGFIHLGLHTITLIVNTIVCIGMMYKGYSVQVVKLISSLIYVVQTLIMSFYVKKHYNINKKLVLKEEPIKQKWNGFAQHLAAVVWGNTDVVVLTLFSTLENVSIYSVYHLVLNGIKQLITSMTAGVSAMFGNMLAKKEYTVLEKAFSKFEWIIHTGVTLVFSISSVLLIPFVRVYTSQITDTNYIVPIFAMMLTIAQAGYCLRLPYNIMILAAGHYKETQISAIIEAAINVSISILAVFKWGLVGVAVGTALAMSYRICYQVWYLTNNILNRKIIYFGKHLAVDILTVIILVNSVRWINLKEISYIAWFEMGIKTTVICMFECFIINFLFYRKDMMEALNSLKYKFIRKGK